MGSKINTIVLIEKSLLSVEGMRKTSDAADNEQSTHRQERFEGQFKRVVTLPEEVDADKANAVYQEGVLHITMPQKTEVKPRQITVSVA
ncbi:MAG: Unknown protein [uncultured Thiotrichaceae bacterium]|uniref:SHSP domain-containing protein n=1 Tax=uncultured Thiotrichaceae bacterium TaxID=298394 RepID=A0A6S6SN95_9GAMM|nr:MAG: Unknown protein [uncultured Thiotrichaceae bacterium]